MYLASTERWEDGASVPVFYWQGDIGEETADAVERYARGLLQLKGRGQSVGAVFVWNTLGGSSRACCEVLESYEKLRAGGVDVWTVAEGEALSAGAHLVAAGDKGRRFVFGGGVLGVHSTVIRNREGWIAREVDVLERGLITRAEENGYFIDARRAGVVGALAQGMGRRAAEQELGWRVEISNAVQLAGFAGYVNSESALKAVGAMMGSEDMTYLVPDAALALGLIDGSQPPPWLRNALLSVLRQAHEKGDR